VDKTDSHIDPSSDTDNVNDVESESTTSETQLQSGLEHKSDSISPTKKPPVIELDNLSVSFGKPVLNQLSAKVDGRCIGLLGPNGAGKTTLLNTLLGFTRPSGGTARIMGFDVFKQKSEVHGVIGYMPERDAFISGMTGIRFVRLMAELSGLNPRDALERAHEVYFYVGLGEARYRTLDSYSLGMKQLAKLAQAIVHGPKLLFLDEPTNGLDPPARARMLNLIREIRDSGNTRIIMASHLLQDVESCCDEVLVLKKGKIATYCNLEEERQSNRKFLLLQVRGDEDSFVNGLREWGCEVARPSRRHIKAILPEDISIRHLYALAKELSVQIRQLDHKSDSLEDVFFRAMESE
jgi:ABC-2 type transport system ATP-binding protein